jgi:hypothetical protein
MNKEVRSLRERIDKRMECRDSIGRVCAGSVGLFMFLRGSQRDE